MKTTADSTRDTVRGRRQMSRRRLLEVGSLSPLGLTLPGLLHARPRESEQTANDGFGTARSCVVIFLWGGPGQQDLWDLKPEAPAEQRGEFLPVATNVPGVRISEHLPRLSRQADKFTIIRSVTHRDFEHGSAAYTALTGHPHPRPGTNTPASPNDVPTYGAVVSKLSSVRRPVPNSVVLGPVMHQGNRPPLAGQNAGFLGLAHEPFRVAADPSQNDFHISGLDYLGDVPPRRLDRRYELLNSLQDLKPNRFSGRVPGGLSDVYERAFGMLRSKQTKQAFALESERRKLRDGAGRVSGRPEDAGTAGVDTGALPGRVRADAEDE
eukprot:g10460.t1